MLSKGKIREVHEDINAALAAVAKKHGLVLSQASKVVYDATTFKFTTQFAEAGAAGDAGIVDPKLISNANRFGLSIGLPHTMLGKSFEDTRLGTVTYIGMTSRDKAVVKAADGRMYRFKAHVVAQMLKGE